MTVLRDRPPLLIATSNRGKLAEYADLLGDVPFTLRSPRDLASAPPEPREAGATYLENALLKAHTYAAATGMLSVADDSGLEVDALAGDPGVHTRRYFGEDLTDEARNRRLLELLAGRHERGARFVCVIALGWPDGRVETFQGVARGRIAEAPAGGHGFGYDPLFVADGQSRTMAELPPEQKHRLSHRGHAAEPLRERLDVLGYTVAHVATEAAWRSAREAGEYRDASLASDGFIHCSWPWQVARVASALFRGRGDLVLLLVDTRGLRAALRLEPAWPAEGFPHLYGPLNLDAVVRSAPYAPRPDGRFPSPEI